MADMFIKIGDLPGESPDEDKAGADGWIQVESWNWGMSQSAGSRVGEGIGAAKVQIQDLNFNHNVDASSADLMQHCCKGTHHKEAELVVRKAGGTNPLSFVRIQMGKVLIAGVTTSGVGLNELTENVALHFEEVKVTYTAQGPKGESLGEYKMSWNIRKNSPNTEFS